jgi:putative transposase
MKQKRRSMEEIIRIIRQADGGQTVREVCREHNVHEVTFHRWKRKYGGLKLDDAQKLKGLEKENAELKKMLAETLLEVRALKIVNAKKWQARRTSAKRSPSWWNRRVTRCAGRVVIFNSIVRPSSTGCNDRRKSTPGSSNG